MFSQASNAKYYPGVIDYLIRMKWSWMAIDSEKNNASI